MSLDDDNQVNATRRKHVEKIALQITQCSLHDSHHQGLCTMIHWVRKTTASAITACSNAYVFKSAPMSFWNRVYAKFKDACGEGQSGPPIECHWTEQETGQYVMNLKSQIPNCGNSITGFAKFCEGIAFAKERCPPSNRSWLDLLVHKVKVELDDYMRKSSNNSFPLVIPIPSTCLFPDDLPHIHIYFLYL